MMLACGIIDGAPFALDACTTLDLAIHACLASCALRWTSGRPVIIVCADNGSWLRTNVTRQLLEK